MGQNFTRSLDRLLTLSPRYVMVSCLTHRDGNGGRGGEGGELDARQEVALHDYPKNGCVGDKRNETFFFLGKIGSGQDVA